MTTREDQLLKAANRHLAQQTRLQETVDVLGRLRHAGALQLDVHRLERDH